MHPTHVSYQTSSGLPLCCSSSSTCPFLPEYVSSTSLVQQLDTTLHPMTVQAFPSYRRHSSHSSRKPSLRHFISQIFLHCLSTSYTNRTICQAAAFPSTVQPQCVVLVFRCRWPGRSGGVGTPQVRAATKGSTTWNCAIISCQQAFHWV